MPAPTVTEPALRASAALRGSVRTEESPPKWRRRPSRTLVAVAVVLVGALAGAWAWTSTTTTTQAHHRVAACGEQAIRHRVRRDESARGDIQRGPLPRQRVDLARPDGV